MSEPFATPQDAEDAFYDAIDDADAAKMRSVWEDSDDIACLLPMQALTQGPEVHKVWDPLMRGEARIDIQVRHLRWLELGEVSIHYVEEVVNSPQGGPQPPMYATNAFRRGDTGWRMILHQNSPAPPPLGSMPMGMGSAAGTG